MVTLGGEVAFVNRMIEESCVVKDRVQWYTSMLGKLGSVTDVVETLKKKGIGNWAVTEFVQGTKTRRWGVAWSWGDMRPRLVCRCFNVFAMPRLICKRTLHEASTIFPNTSCPFLPTLVSRFQDRPLMLSQGVSIAQSRPSMCSGSIDRKFPQGLVSRPRTSGHDRQGGRNTTRTPWLRYSRRRSLRSKRKWKRARMKRMSMPSVSGSRFGKG